MPRPLPVTTATFPLRFMAPTLVLRIDEPLGELDFHVLAARLISRLPVDQVRDRIGSISEEHGVMDLSPLQCGGGHLVGEASRIAVVAMLGGRVPRADPNHTRRIP